MILFDQEYNRNFAASSKFMIEQEKKMKKVFCIILILVLGFTFASCAIRDTFQQMNAVRLYKAGQRRLEKATALDVDIVIDAKISSHGATLSQVISMNLKAVGIQSLDTLQFLAEISLPIMGQSLDMQLYYADGWGYVDVLGFKIKQEMSAQEAAGVATETKIDYTMTPDMLDDAQITPMSGGGYMFHLTLNSEEFERAFEETLSSNGVAQSGTYDFNEVLAEIIIDKKGNLVSQHFSVDFTAISGDLKTQYADFLVQYDIQYNAYNKDVVLVPPENLDAYRDDITSEVIVRAA